MINVSNEFRETMAERTDFRCNAIITLGDGTVMELDDTAFTLSNNSLTDAAEAESFPLGIAVCRSIQIELMNDEEQLSDIDFYAARIRLFLTFQLSETVEKVELGTFTVNSPATYGTTVLVDAVDDMWKADQPYSTGLIFPATLSAIYLDLCESIGVPYETGVFRNSGTTLTTPPTSEYTFRDILGYIAMLAGGNARISPTGYMQIKSYDFSLLSAENEGIERLADWVNLKTDTNDITITGIQTTVSIEDEEGTEQETTLLNGEEGYALTIENPLIADDPTSGLALIAGNLLGGTFRKFEGDYIAYPIGEFMDAIAFQDRKGNQYYSFLTDINFVFGGMTTLSNSADSNIRNNSAYSSPSSSAVIEAKRLINQQRTATEARIDAINQTLANASGMYRTEESQEDGSVIYYLHDKATLAGSASVIKMTADAIGFSTDGGETYPYAFTVTGDAVLKILAAEGINADWIKAGEMRADVIFTGTLIGASGTFGHLTAGNAATQRLELGIDDVGDPILNIYDSNGELKLSLVQTGIQFDNKTNFTSYSVGTKKGIGVFVGV